MSSTSPQTSKELGDVFLSQLRSEHAAAVARAEQASIEAARLAKEAENLAGALEAAEKFVSQMIATTAPIVEEVTDKSNMRQEWADSMTALAEVVEADSPRPRFAVVPHGRSRSLIQEEWAARLRGLTQKEALIAIAEREGGELDVTKARDIFIETGLTKSKEPRAVYGIIHSLLRDSDRFEKGGPGEFRLISPSPGMIGQPKLQEWLSRDE